MILNPTKQVILVATSFVFIVLVAFDPLRFPVKNGDMGSFYLRGLRSVYKQDIRGCGWLGCPEGIFRLLSFNTPVKSANPWTFELVDAVYGLAKDNRSVYFLGDEVKGSDPDTLVDYGDYAIDSKYIYHHGLIIDFLDKETFQLLGPFYKDKNGVYTKTYTKNYEAVLRKVDIVDPDSLKVGEKGQRVGKYEVLAEDKNFYYGFGQSDTYLSLLGSKNNNGITKLGCMYYKFDNKVYYRLYQIPGADVNTFKVIPKEEGGTHEYCGGDYAVDKDKYYHGDVLLDDLSNIDKNISLDEINKRLNVSR